MQVTDDASKQTIEAVLKLFDRLRELEDADENGDGVKSALPFKANGYHFTLTARTTPASNRYPMTRWQFVMRLDLSRAKLDGLDVGVGAAKVLAVEEKALGALFVSWQGCKAPLAGGRYRFRYDDTLKQPDNFAPHMSRTPDELRSSLLITDTQDPHVKGFF